ncbi:alpha-1,3-mannosyltransferase ALG2 [Pluteus cervinus]|uniref:Alpha-1,3-mannosyltransferase ALG2 n=1 Tax=Pluteus cervinus TaxID=181527 RepID=A0ACD3AAN1_9AGAR|nr:alpha-1,3-mannosyltransferase ALG2 [Pluteus cervinus]
MSKKLKIAFIHPDLGIGGAERLVVDAALGLLKRGHKVDIYTSHHDPSHCFEETRDGTLNVHALKPPLPRSIRGKFHILFAHLRQLHLTAHLLLKEPTYDVYFVDQLSTCIPFLRAFGGYRVVFYCHFPDKLLANGEFVEGDLRKKKVSLVKALYRLPMDWLEEVTTRQADVLLANSKFTARVFQTYFKSINRTPTVVYPGINLEAYNAKVDKTDPNIVAVTSSHPTLLSLNRFEKKKNAALAIQAFAILRSQLSKPEFKNLRLVLAGGYDPRLEDNMLTLYSLIDLAKSHSLSYNVITPSSDSPVKIPPLNMTPDDPNVLFLLNFTTSQRTALLRSPSTRALLYTPANEHFGIGPVEAMSCGVPVLACDTGGPTESILDPGSSTTSRNERTGWLRPPQPEVWATALLEILSLKEHERRNLAVKAKGRASTLFGMEAMAVGLEKGLLEAVAMGEVKLVKDIWVIMIFVVLLSCMLGPSMTDVLLS